MRRLPAKKIGFHPAPTGGTVSTCLSTGAGTSITTNANTACGSNEFGALTNAAPGSTSYSTVVLENEGSLTANTVRWRLAAAPRPHRPLHCGRHERR